MNELLSKLAKEAEYSANMGDYIDGIKEHFGIL